MKTKLLLLPIMLLVALSSGVKAQSGVMNVNDPIVTYDPLNPPTFPPYGTLKDWVRTVRVNWDTDSYKCYIYKSMPFRLKFPKNYDTTGATKYPMIVMFHGRGNYAVSLYDNEKPLHTGSDGGRRYRDAVDDDEFDGFIMFPQNTSGFFNDAHFDALHDLFVNYMPEIHVDINRISLTGSSAGAYSTWNAIIRHPEDYSALLPMSGISTNNIAGLNNIREVPVWYFQGGKDKSPAPYTANLVKTAAENLGMDFKYTEYPNGGHGIWPSVYKEPDLLPYMTRSNKTNPVVYFGKSEFCPGDPIQATLALTNGFDGYEWRKDGVVISGATSHKLNVTQLGTYDARIKRGNTWSYWSVDPVVIKMKDSTITPPVEVVGNATHVLPGPDSVNQVTLTVNGVFTSYEWKAAGTSTVLGTDATFTTSTPGDYVVSVVEKFGCQSSDSPVFSVLSSTAVNGPGAPNGLNVFSVSKTALKLIWNNNPSALNNETAFEIYRSQTAGGNYEYIGSAQQDAVEYLDEDLISNTTYYYVIRAINENAASAITAEAHATTQADNQLPSAPFNVSLVTTSTSSISIKWNTSLDDVGIEKYEVYIAGVKSVVTSDTFATVYNLFPNQTYNLTVKARDFAGNYSPSSLPVTATTVFTGLNYKYYEGAWNNLPNFRNLTPVDSGHVDSIDISLKQVTDDYGFLWEGMINIPVAGNYTFETRSDDGSKVYIGGYDTGVVVVNNDGRHSARYRSGTYNFPAAGAYPIAVTFFRNGGSETMQLYWKNTAHGIGSSREIIPNSAFSDFKALPGNPPASPRNLQATAVSYDQIDLTWADSSNNESGFVIMRKSSNGEYIPVTTTAANVTSYSDTKLQASTTYDYKVIAIGSYGMSVAAAANSEFSLNFNNNINDQSGNLSSSLENGAGYTTDSKEGSHALSLDGINDYVKLGPGNGFFHNLFAAKTIAMWVKIEDHSGNRVLYDEGGTGQGIAMRIINGQLEAAVRQSSNQFTIGAAFTDTNWAHIALVFDAGRFSLYINGALAAENSDIGYNQITNHGDGAGLGGTNGGNSFSSNGDRTKGSIDDLFIFLEALDVPEINTLMLRNSIYDKATTFALPAVPASPTNLSLTALSPSVVQLNWDDNSTNEVNFGIYRSSNSSNNFIPLGTINGDTTSGTETYLDSGLFANALYNYFVVATNAGGSDSTAAQSVTTLNNAPDLDQTLDVMVRYNTNESVQLYATDLDGDSITFTASNLPAFATLTDYQDGSGLISISPLIADTNDYPNIVVIATDANGGVSTDTFIISVIDNFLPTIAAIANVTIDEGDSTSVLVTANDSNGVSSLAWSASRLPAFASFTASNNGTAVLTFAPGFADGGTYEDIEISVNDNNGGTAIELFDITVNEVNPNRLIKVNFRHSVAAASPWNNVNSLNPTALNDENGNPTGFGVDILGTAWNSYNQGGNTGNNSGVVPDDVLKEYYYFGIFGAPNTVDFNITGLSASGAYNLSLVSSSVWNGTPNNGTTNFTVGSQTESVYAHYNTTASADFNLLSPNSNGEITVTMSKASGTTVGYINGFILEEIHNYGAAPDAARDLTASYGAGGVQLSWYDAPYNETGYNVLRSDSANGTFSQINSQPLSADATQYTDNNVSENQTYYYSVQAVNSFGVSSLSNVADAFVPNTAPSISITGDSVMNPNQTVVLNITATDSPGNTISLSGVNLPSWASLTDSANGNGTITLAPQGGDAGNYSFSVKAMDNLGAHSTASVNITVNDQKLYSVYVNFSNNFNVPAPWNNTSKAPAVNDVFTNLKDDANNSTPISMQLTTAFGGVYNEGAQTGNNSGIVPDNALREYYYFGIFGAPNQTQLKISGLDNQKKYTFRFVGSSTFTGAGITNNGETNYSIGSQTASVNVHGNTSNDAVISGIIANNNGEVFIDMTKGNGASVGYINALIIDVFDADTTQYDPENLTATATSTSSINLNWKDNSLDEVGFEIQRSTTGLEIDFVAIDTVGANVVNYADNNLNSNSVYHYRVRGLRGASNTGYTNIASSGTIAFSVFININGNSQYDAPAPWNNLSIAASNDDVFTGFKNNFGNPSGLEMVWNIAMAGSNEWGTTTGNNSGVYPDLVMQSFFFNDAFDPQAEITMRGLSQAYTYNFKFFGAIVTSFDIRTKFSIGNTTVTNSQTNNTSEVVSINGVSPDNNNEVDINLYEDAGSNWAIFNAMVIEAITAAPLNSSKKKSEISSDTDGNRIAVNYGNAAPEISIYPNPLRGDRFAIGFRDAAPGNMEVIIRDLTGRVVKEATYLNELQNGQVEVDLADANIQHGVYVVTTKFANGSTSTARMVKVQ